LPRSLEYIYYDEYKIKYIDDAKIEIFNGNFDIKKYQVFRRFQIRCRLFTTKRFNTAKENQNGSYNWLNYLKKLLI
jgi:hypothetical protein